MRVAAIFLVLAGVLGTPGAGLAVTLDAVSADALASDMATVAPLTVPLPAVAENLPAPVEPRANALPPGQPVPTSVPDTNSWALLIIGLGLAGLVARRRRDTQRVSA